MKTKCIWYFQFIYQSVPFIRKLRAGGTERGFPETNISATRGIRLRSGSRPLGKRNPACFSVFFHVLLRDCRCCPDLWIEVLGSQEAGGKMPPPAPWLFRCNFKQHHPEGSITNPHCLQYFLGPVPPQIRRWCFLPVMSCESQPVSYLRVLVLWLRERWVTLGIQQWKKRKNTSPMHRGTNKGRLSPWYEGLAMVSLTGAVMSWETKTPEVKINMWFMSVWQ